MLIPDDESLKSIAASLETLAKSGNDWVPTIASVIVSFITTIITAAVTMQSVRRPQEEKETAQKKQMRDLLYDEIHFRWAKNLKPDLRKITQLGDHQQVSIMAGILVSADDLPIVNSVRDTVLDFHFLGDAQFVSRCVYASLLMHDMVDMRSWAGALVREAQANPYLLGPLSGANLGHWREYRRQEQRFVAKFKSIIDDIDATLELISRDIQAERDRINHRPARAIRSAP